MPPDAPGDERAEEPERVAVGVINAPWGVRGHVKVTPLTGNAERFVKGARLYVRGEQRRVVDVRHPRGYPVVLFDGVDAGGADRLRGALIEIDERDLPALPAGEHYVHDLIGLTAVTPEGEALGTVEDVLRTGSNDVYVVTRRGQPDVLVPVLEGVVGDVDLEARTVVVVPVPGLLG